jgi:hypothetical protein
VNIEQIESEPMIVAAHIEIPIDTLKTEIKTLWAAFKQNGIELAPRLYQLQIELSSPGKKDSGLKAWLKEAGIPRSTAYRLIKDYMQRMGLLPAMPEPATVSQMGQGDEAEPAIGSVPGQGAEAEPEQAVETTNAHAEAASEPESLPVSSGEIERRAKEFRKDLYKTSGALAADLDSYITVIKRYISPAEEKEAEALRIWDQVIMLREEEQRVLNDRRRKVRKSLAAEKEQRQRVAEGWRPLECLIKAWEEQEAEKAIGDEETR